MRLTTKGRFAVTAMIDLAMRQHSGPVTLAAISQRQNISLSYLEQLFGKLRRHELVDSVRGPGGGYSLARLARSHGSRHHFRGRRTPGRHQLWRQARLHQRQRRQAGQVHDPRTVDHAESQDGRLPGLGLAADLVDQQRVRQLREAANQAQGCSAVRVNRSTPVAANATA